MTDEYKIKTGNTAGIKTSDLEKKLDIHLSILYSGMPNDQTFALTAVSSVGQHIPALHSFFMPDESHYLIYYRKDSKEINVLDKRFRVVYVNPDEILLQKLG
jgi:hypothetical protein